MKKLVLAMSTLLMGLSNNGLALDTSTVRVPCFQGGFTGGVTGFYLRPFTPALDIAELQYNATLPPFFSLPAFESLTAADSSYVNIKPHYSGAYRLDFDYLFSCSSNDVAFSYLNFRSHKHQNLDNLPNGTGVLGTITFFNSIQLDSPGLTSDVQVDSNANFSYQAADLNFGQYLNLGCKTRLRYWAGARFAELSHQFDVNYLNQFIEAPNPALQFSAAVTSQHCKFRGLGPRFGVDGSYQVGCGFAVVGQTGMGLIVGDMRSGYTEISNNVLLPFGLTVNAITLPEETRVAPNLTGKLGVSYTYPVSNCSKVVLEAGYQVDHYFNTVDRLNVNIAVFPETRIRDVIDTSFDGPYLSVEFGCLGLDTYNPGACPNVTIPSLPNQFMVGVTGLYLRPSTEELDYAVFQPNFDNVFDVLNIDNHHKGGYKIDVGYAFPCTGNDITLTFTHIEHKNSTLFEYADLNSDAFASLASTEVVLLPLIGAFSPERLVTAEAKFRYQALDLDVGQHLCLGSRSQFRLFGGLRGADLKHQINAEYICKGFTIGNEVTGEEIVFSGRPVTDMHQQTEFKGLGPRLGWDASYCLGCGFKALAQSTGALLVGNIVSHLNTQTRLVPDDMSFIFGQDSALSYLHQTRIVPNMTAKLGLEYSYQFCNCNRTRLSVEAGYLVDHYYNSIDRLSGFNEFQPNPSNGGFTTETRHTMDTSYDGPYAAAHVYF